MRIVLALALVGCGASATPPDLPGDAPPPCTLASPASYLIDTLSVPDRWLLPIDLQQPPVMSVGSYNYPFFYLNPVTSGLATATQNSVSSRNVLWIVQVQSCADPASPYAQVSFRRGTSISTTSVPFLVSLTNDDFRWSVGSVAHGAIDAFYGMGEIPVTVGIDIQADTQPPGWFAGNASTVHMVSADSTRIAGVISAAVQIDLTVADVSAAVARTLTMAASENPTCPGANCPDPFLGDLLSSFDRNQDRTVSVDEVMGGDRLEGVLDYAADLDLLAPYEGALVYWPDHDGVLDSVGLSYAFEATQVTIVE